MYFIFTRLATLLERARVFAFSACLILLSCKNISDESFCDEILKKNYIVKLESTSNHLLIHRNLNKLKKVT